MRVATTEYATQPHQRIYRTEAGRAGNANLYALIMTIVMYSVQYDVKEQERWSHPEMASEVK